MSYIFLGCGKGYFAVSTGSSTFNRSCMICPKGSFSITDTAENCNECPPGQTTAKEGSTNSSDCQGGKVINILLISRT